MFLVRIRPVIIILVVGKDFIYAVGLFRQSLFQFILVESQMSFIIRGSNADGRGGIVLALHALHRGRDGFAHSSEHIADDLIVIQQARFDLLVPLLNLGLGHAGLLRLGEGLIIRAGIIVPAAGIVLLRKVVDELIVVLHELLDVLDNLIRILGNGYGSRSRSLLQEVIRHAAHVQGIVLDAFIFLTVDFDFSVGTHAPFLIARRKVKLFVNRRGHSCGILYQFAALRLNKIQIIEELRRILTAVGSCRHGQLNAGLFP